MKYDAEVAIIGAGPLGLELAAALKLSGIPFVLFDKGQVAQMVYNYPPQTTFFSSTERIGIAGIPIQTDNQQKCSREHYLAYIRSVIMHYGLKIHSYEEVIDLRRTSPDAFLIHTATLNGTKNRYQVRYVVLATGGTSKPRTLNVPGEELPHVSVKMEDPHRYFQKRIVIVGGKNSAAESALRCYNAGAKVTLVTRNPLLDPKSIKYWILPELKNRIEKGEIVCHLSSEVVEILPDRMRIREIGSGELSELSADFVIKAIGFEADMGLCRMLHLELSQADESPIYDMETMETTVKDVFVLGTVIGGTQKRYRIFIENTHIHVRRIIDTLCNRLGIKPPALEGWLSSRVVTTSQPEE